MITLTCLESMLGHGILQSGSPFGKSLHFDFFYGFPEANGECSVKGGREWREEGSEVCSVEGGGE